MRSWIRLNTLLPDSPKVAAVAQEMAVSRDAALGVMVRWLCWVDTYCTDAVTGLRADDVDSMLGSGACAALVEVGWVEVHGLSVHVVDFDEYLSPTSKKRALTARRVARAKARGKQAKQEGGER